MTLRVSAEDHADEQSYNVEHLSAIALIKDDDDEDSCSSCLLYDDFNEVKKNSKSGKQKCPNSILLAADEEERSKKDLLLDHGATDYATRNINCTADHDGLLRTTYKTRNLNCKDPDGQLLLSQYYTVEQIQQHNLAHHFSCGEDCKSITSFWCCIDGFVVDATEYYQTRVHPGGERKVLQTNDANIGNENKPMSFSFTKGKNAHFPETARTFQESVKQFLKGGSNEVVFPDVIKKNGELAHGGTIYIIGRLLHSSE
jgi:hypothetical protein